LVTFMLLTVKSEHKEPNMSPHIYRMLVAEKLAELRRRSKRHYYA